MSVNSETFILAILFGSVVAFDKIVFLSPVNLDFVCYFISIHIGRLTHLFEGIIAAFEYINNDVKRMQVEYIAKIRNCLGLFTEFG